MSASVLSFFLPLTYGKHFYRPFDCVLAESNTETNDRLIDSIDQTLRNAAAGLLEDNDDDDVEADIEPPDYKNYKSYLPKFTLAGLRARLAARVRTNNQACGEATAELALLYREFRKSVLLVCWAGGFSEAVADSAM